MATSLTPTSTRQVDTDRDPLGVEAVELRRIRLPLVTPFRTSFGTQYERDILLVRVLGGDAEGWSECVALEEPVYSAEYIDGAQHVLERFLLPRLFAAGPIGAHEVRHVLAPIVGHRMAKGAIELAWLDAELRRQGRSFAREMGATRESVPSGVSVGIMDSIPQLLDTVEGYLDEGYVRIKLKIEPGWDIDAVAAVRERFGDIPLQVDANTAYRLKDVSHLRRLDAFDLLLIEQPFPEEQIRAHAVLHDAITTPVCLDESITSAQVCVDAILLGAVDIVNIKAGRVGGYLEAKVIHDVCAAHDVPVWCGGMVEAGLGRAANMALAAAPNFTLPGDTSASSRFYERDIITEPFELRDGHIDVPRGPGLGVTIDEPFVREITTDVVTVTP